MAKQEPRYSFQLLSLAAFLLLISLIEGRPASEVMISKIITADAKPVIWRKQRENITMNCTVLLGGAAHRITWMKHGKRIPATSEGHSWSALVISKLKESDAGKYRCVAVGKTRDVSMVHLHVEARPKIKFQRGYFSPTPRVVVRGDTLCLQCFASGDPRPSYQWTRNGDVIRDDPIHRSYGYLLQPRANGLELRIDAITHKEAGMYTCKATNRVGTAKYKVEVVVTDLILPLPPEVKTVSPVVTAVQGKNTTLSCTGKYVPRGYSYVFWMFKDQEIDDDEKYSIRSQFYTIRDVFAAKMMVNTSLIIRKVDQVDKGPYACVVSSHIGTDQRKLELVVTKKGKSTDVLRR